MPASSHTSACPRESSKIGLVLAVVCAAVVYVDRGTVDPAVYVYSKPYDSGSPLASRNCNFGVGEMVAMTNLYAMIVGLDMYDTVIMTDGIAGRSGPVLAACASM